MSEQSKKLLQLDIDYLLLSLLHAMENKDEAYAQKIKEELKASQEELSA